LNNSLLCILTAKYVDRTPDRKKFPVGNRDLRAVDEVLRHDLKLRLPEIRAVWKAHHRTIAAPVVAFDYTVHPPRFSTTSHTSADACLTLHSCGTTRQTLFWKETVEIVDGERKLGVDKGIILIMVAAGVTPYSTSITTTLADVENTITSPGPLFGSSATLSVG
jgi:hypothetical protein